jgi:hypothetical protein
MWHFTCERIHMKSHVTFHMWKDFTWNYKWNFTCERSSHEIINCKWNFTCERISHERYKLQVTFHMWKDFTSNYKLQVKFHMWKDKDFTWHYKLQSEISHVRERISHEITTEISHVKGFHMKLQITCTSEISHVWKDFTWNYKWNFTVKLDKDFTWHYKLQSEISHIRERISHEITTEISHVKGFARNYKLQWNFAFERISHEITSSGGARPQKLGGIWGANSYFLGGGKIELLSR